MSDGLLRLRRALPVTHRRYLPSFYDWYCDLPPASPRPGASRPTCRSSLTGTTPATSSPGALTLPRTRTPDAHFFTEVRYKGTKTVAVTRTTPKSPNCATCGWRRNRVRCRHGAGDGPRHAA
ncbi:hypothetical protein ACVXG7_12005 [Enterobacter hormaechei]